MLFTHMHHTVYTHTQCCYQTSVRTEQNWVTLHNPSQAQPRAWMSLHSPQLQGIWSWCGIILLLRGWHLRENDGAMQDQALFPWRRNPLPLDPGRSASLSVLTAPEIRPGCSLASGASKLFSTRCCLCALRPLSQGLVFQRRNLFSPIPLIVTSVSDFIQVAARHD